MMNNKNPFSLCPQFRAYNDSIDNKIKINRKRQKTEIIWKVPSKLDKVHPRAYSKSSNNP